MCEEKEIPTVESPLYDEDYEGIAYEDRNYVKVYNDHWKVYGDVENEDGTLNKDKVMRELSNYHFLLENVPLVYMEYTNGILSYPNYKADTVTTLGNERQKERYMDYTKSDVLGILDEYRPNANSHVTELIEQIEDYFEIDEEYKEKNK